MSVIIRNKIGNVVSKSKNLRQLRRRASRDLIDEIHIDYPEGRAFLHVNFVNGDTCSTVFASYSVLCGWVGRWRSVYGTKLFMDGEYRGVVDLHNQYLQAGNLPS